MIPQLSKRPEIKVYSHIEHSDKKKRHILMIYTPAWFLNSANRPKDRKKRGMRKGKRFGGKVAVR